MTTQAFVISRSSSPPGEVGTDEIDGRMGTVVAVVAERGEVRDACFVAKLIARFSSRRRPTTAQAAGGS
jgi:hypothetical protein